MDDDHASVSPTKDRVLSSRGLIRKRPDAVIAPPFKSTTTQQQQQQQQQQSLQYQYNARFLRGLTLAGVASSLLTTVFGLFHVDVFLRVYELPLSTYATGNLIFSFINTANDLLGAWLVDAAAATTASRSAMVGIAGCLYAACFLSPFFRWTTTSTLWGAGTHFVLSMSLYDTMYSFMAILLGSVVTDNHQMSDTERVRFMASGKAANLVASALVARLGLAVFETDDMSGFQGFLLLLAMMVSVMFLTAQAMMENNNNNNNNNSNSVVRTNDGKPKKPLRLRIVLRDFINHGNFRAWIGMEMLLECQRNFAMSFLKTFVDRLVMGPDVTRDTCDWFLSLIRPLTQIGAILCYIPIQRFGYHRIYMIMFLTNLLLSVLVVAVGSPSSPWIVIVFLLLYTVGTGAVLSAGFHLAMSDMVLEMKHKHATQNRFDEPSVAGLFMGANALLCKPMESFLPIVAAVVLDETHFQDESKSEKAQWVLFYLMVGPPIAFSGLQMLSWSQYNLSPSRTSMMRDELKRLTTHDNHNAAQVV